MVTKVIQFTASTDVKGHVAGVKTKVVFRKWKEGEVIALFPDVPWSRHGSATTSYMHVGQHGAADYAGVIAATWPAREPEYRDLLAELKAIGYDDLRVVKRARPKFN